MRKVIILSIFSVFLTACVSNNITEMTAEESREYLDLTLDGKKKLLKNYWLVEKRQHPKYPLSAARAGLSGCVDLFVGINANGKLGGYKIKKSYPEGIFDQSAVTALNNFKWEATAKNTDRKPVLTTIQLDFQVQDSKNIPEAKSECWDSHNI